MFNSQEEYEEKLSEILGRKSNLAFAIVQNPLATGFTYEEDFESLDLLSFITTALEKREFMDLNIEMECTSNLVSYEGMAFNSNTQKISVDNLDGYPVTSIDIETANSKEGLYDRKLTIQFPQSTYDEMGIALHELMEQRTDESAAYSGFTQKGNNQAYEIFYQDIDIETLLNVTKLFLDCNETNVYYGDKNNASTPLAEQLIFEEEFNTLSFFSENGEDVPLRYSYSLPIATTHGQGMMLEKGAWQQVGDWVDGVYIYENSGKAYTLRIPDGMQYKVEGFAVDTKNNGNGEFEKTFDIEYDKNTGIEACEYAINYFNELGISATSSRTDKYVVCTISKAGSIEDINSFYHNIFGENNEFSRKENTSSMAVVTDINFTDNISISYMLTPQNFDVPFMYTYTNLSQENINMVTGKENGKNKEVNIENNIYSINYSGGENSISVTSTEPNSEGVIWYCIIIGIMFVVIGLIMWLIINSGNRKKR